MKIIQEKSYASGSIIIRLSQKENIWVVEAINLKKNKNLVKEFNDKSEALNFFRFIVKQQDDFPKTL